jgi:hypothetical protein
VLLAFLQGNLPKTTNSTVTTGLMCAAGDVADGVDQRHDQHAPHNGDARERSHAILLVHQDHAAAGEDQEERRQELGDELWGFTRTSSPITA